MGDEIKLNNQEIQNQIFPWLDVETEKE